MSKIGITMINMYCNMIKQEFAPILDEIDSREVVLKQDLEILVKKDFGIYSLYEEKAKLKLKLEEIERQLKGWEERRRTASGDYKSPIEERVGSLMNKVRNGLRKEVEKEMNNLMNRIKLAGVSSDIQNLFADLPDIIDKLAKKVESLPEYDAKKLLPQKTKKTKEKTQ